MGQRLELSSWGSSVAGRVCWEWKEELGGGGAVQQISRSLTIMQSLGRPWTLLGLGHLGIPTLREEEQGSAPPVLDLGRPAEEGAWASGWSLCAATVRAHSRVRSGLHLGSTMGKLCDLGHALDLSDGFSPL